MTQESLEDLDYNSNRVWQTAFHPTRCSHVYRAAFFMDQIPYIHVNHDRKLKMIVSALYANL